MSEPRTVLSAPRFCPPYRPRIIAETSDWLAVDKPPFLQVHPSKPSDIATLWDELRALLAFEIVNGGQVSIINRLDRETSGVTLVAKSRTAARHLAMQMNRREIQKEYVALIHGWPVSEKWTVTAPLLRQAKVRPSRVWVKQCVHPLGANAVTHFSVEQRFTRADLPFATVRACPETGRMHQIRVHLLHSGHPIVGDKLYGRDENCYLEFIESGWTQGLASQLLLPRQALHSCRLLSPELDLVSPWDWRDEFERRFSYPSPSAA